MESVRNGLLITTDEEEQHDILAWVAFWSTRMEVRRTSMSNYVEIIRKVPRGTQHNWHKLLENTIFPVQDETEAKET